MNQRLHAILIGLILGDGYLMRSYGSSGTSAIDIKGDDKNLVYLQWLHEELSPLGVSELKPKKNYHQHRFYTRKSRDIGLLRDLFYPDGIKIIPESITQLLTDPLSLAVWYQDDGSLDYRNKYHCNAVIATHCFSFDDCQMLAQALQENFGLDVRVHKCTMRAKLHFKLYVTSRSMSRFMRLIAPHILSCFDYKLASLSSQQPR